MASFYEITAKKLVEQYNLNDFTLIDVREIFEYQQNHIENSINIPLSALLREIENYHITKPIIMICQAGKRSKIACELLLADNHDGYQLYNLTDGMIGWQQLYRPI